MNEDICFSKVPLKEAFLEKEDDVPLPINAAFTLPP